MLREWLKKLQESSELENRRVILDLIESNRSAKLLDLGCGDGDFTLQLGNRLGTKQIYSVEIADEFRGQPEKRGIKVHVADLNEPLPIESQSFDVVHANQVIEHIYKTDIYLRELHRLLKPGGYAIISTPNLASFYIIVSLILGVQPVAAAVSDEMQLRVSKYDGSFLEFSFKGVHEENVTKKLKNIIHENMTVVDIGASFGYYVIFAAKLIGGKGKVFAFEPDPSSYNLLQENIELNRLKNVISVQKAVSNKAGTTKLWLAPSKVGSSNILRPRTKRTPIVVESTSLDEFFKDFELTAIDILIMDIEGAEFLALQGMRKIMATNENLKMIIEFHPHHIRAFGHSPRELWVELRQNGFWPLFLLQRDGQLTELITQADLTDTEEAKHPIHLFVQRKPKR